MAEDAVGAAKRVAILVMSMAERGAVGRTDEAVQWAELTLATIKQMEAAVAMATAEVRRVQSGAQEVLLANGRAAAENAECRERLKQALEKVERLEAAAAERGKSQSERTRDGLAKLKAKGVHVGGVPLGLKRTTQVDAEGRRVVAQDAEELATAERIRSLRAAGASLRAICDALDAEGRPTKSGGRWAPQTVSQVLRRMPALKKGNRHG